ncbi:MAG: hypothetical protein R8G66_16290 [Cytophagales bacterium]|nr:hypothetical protein [Cytophagales bacterium]
MTLQLILGTLLLLHVYDAYTTQLELDKTSSLGDQKKQWNTILIWIIPFIWPLLVRSMIKKKRLTVMTKGKRKPNRRRGTDDWGNLTGYGGGGSLGD